MLKNCYGLMIIRTDGTTIMRATFQEKCSLIITIYNQARQLALVLDSVARQTSRSFEIVVANDGSSDDVAGVISRFKLRYPGIPIRHVVHQDRGFRKPVILNDAFRAASADYLIVIDGDMLLHERFIENHLRYRGKNRVLCGYRGVKLGQAYTEDLLCGRRQHSSRLWSLVWRSLRGDLDKPWRGTVLHNKLLRRLAVSDRTHLSGCNFSLYRGALMRVNGMDETIREYGYEDYDLGRRLELTGLQLVNVSKCCNTFHLYHPKRARPNGADIKRLIDRNCEPMCRSGLQRLETGSAASDGMIRHDRP